MLFIQGLDFSGEPETIRDVYLIEDEERRAKLRRIYKEARPDGLVLVLTCTRIEAYSVARPVSHEIIERAFGLNHISSGRRRYSMEGEQALRHLFQMSTGILSSLYGEEMIMSQITDGIKAAERLGESCSYLSRLFSNVIAFARRIRNSEKIRVFDRSVADYLVSEIGPEEKTLIIGSGESARMVAEALVKSGRKVTMTLRDEEKIFLVPAGARSISYDERKEHLSEFDIVISASSGLYHTLEKEDGKLLKARALYDLSVPYDIPKEMHPLRLSELPVDMPERRETEKRVIARAEEALEEFLKSIAMKDLVSDAADIAFDVIRRTYSPIDALGISKEEKEKLSLALADSVKKAAISYFNREKRNGEQTYRFSGAQRRQDDDGSGDGGHAR